MSKTLKYTNITEEAYLEASDELEQYGDDFEYEITDKQALEAVSYYVFLDYFSKDSDISGFCSRSNSVKEGIKKFIDDFDLLDTLFEAYEEEVKEYFEEDAYYDRWY